MLSKIETTPVQVNGEDVTMTAVTSVDLLPYIRTYQKMQKIKDSIAELNTQITSVLNDHELREKIIGSLLFKISDETRKLKDATDEYQLIRQDLIDQLIHNSFIDSEDVFDVEYNVSSNNHWGNILHVALQSESPENRVLISRSPINTYMEENYNEILKNSMDAYILRHAQEVYNNPTIDLEPLKLTTMIRYMQNDKVQLIILDNAGGFPVNTLNALSTQIGRDAYKYSKHSNQVIERDCALYPDFFGGAKQGLKLFLRLVEDGFLKEGQGVQYVKNPENKIDFYNQNLNGEYGACISIETTMAPLVVKESVAETQFTSEGLGLSLDVSGWNDNDNDDLYPKSPTFRK